MANQTVNQSQFYVVHIVQKPFKTIDYYVCVPYNWAILKYSDKKMIIAYPKHEDRLITRERTKQKEEHKKEWMFFVAELKYQTDSYDDAERWISKKNTHRLLAVLEGSSPNDTRQKFPRGRGLFGSNQKNSSKPNDKSERTVKPYKIPQKPSLKDTDKISSNESKKEIFLKRLRFSTTETAKSTAQNTDPRPESSKTEQSITIRDEQPKESKTEKTAAANGLENTDGNSQSSKQYDHKPRKPGCNEITKSKGHSQQEQPRETNGSQNQLAHQRRVAHQVENLQKNSAITSKKRLNLIDPTKQLPPLPLRPSVSTQQPSAANLQSPGHQGPSVTAPQNIPKSHQHPIFVRQDIQQNLPAPQEHMQQTHGQELPPKPTEYRFDPRLCLENRPMSELTQHQPIRPSLNNNPTNVPSQFHQPLETHHQAQKAISQQDARQSQSPAYVSNLPKKNRKRPTLQGVTKTTKSLTPSKTPISINQAILTALENFPLNEQEIETILNRISKDQSKSGLINVFRYISAFRSHHLHRPKIPTSTSYQSPGMESPSVHQNLDQHSRTQTQQVNRSDETNLTMKRHVQDDVGSAINQTRVNNIKSQTNLCMQEPSSPNHSAALDSGLDKDRKTTFSNEMSVDESHEPVSETKQTEHNLIEGSNIQNTLSEVIMLQKMLVQFITVNAQVNSTFQDMTTRLYHLWNLIFETTQLHRAFLDSEKINPLKNSASHEPSSKITQEVSSVVEKRPTARPERRNSRNGNQPSNNVTIAPETTHQSDFRRNSNSTRQFALPPEYDSNDTKWTLKYQAHMAGLQELIPNTNIYVRYWELKRIKQRSNSCQLLAQLLLHEVFNEKALSVCAAMSEIVEIDTKMSPEGRPELDNIGFLVLLNFVTLYASRCGWCIDLLEIINALDQEVKEVRMKFGGKSRFQCN